MQKAVDKEEKDEIVEREAVLWSLLARLGEADDYLAARFPRRVREDIGDVRLPSRSDIYFLGLGALDERERDFEGGKHALRHSPKRQNRRFAPGLVSYVYSPHWGLALAARELLGGWVYLAELN